MPYEGSTYIGHFLLDILHSQPSTQLRHRLDLRIDAICLMESHASLNRKAVKQYPFLQHGTSNIFMRLSVHPSIHLDVNTARQTGAVLTVVRGEWSIKMATRRAS